jgi:hypothetical protein
MVRHTTASQDLSVFYVNDSSLLVPGSAKSKTDRTVPSVEDRCTYIKEKKGASGLDAQLIRNAGHTRKLSLSRNKTIFSQGSIHHLMLPWFIQAFRRYVMKKVSWVILFFRKSAYRVAFSA